MVEKISIEIGLDGGEEVNRQLDGVLDTAQKTFSGVQKAADQLDFSALADGFQNVGDTGVEAFDKVKAAAQNAVVFEQVIQGVKKVEGAFESLGTAVTKMATRMTRSLGVFGVLARSFGPIGIAAGVAAGAVLKFGNDSAKALAGLNVEAAKLDLTAQKFDTLQKALAQLGVDAASIAPGLQTLKESLGGDFFQQNVLTGFRNLIAQLELMPDGVARTQLAIARLGDALGGQVIAGLQAGTLNAQNFATALAGVAPATQQQIADAAKYEVALNKLSAAWTELKGAFTPITTPVLQFLAGEIKALASDIRNLIADVKALWGFLKALGGLFTAQGPEQMRAALQGVADAYKQLGQGAQQAGQQVDEQSAQTAAQAGLLNQVATSTTNVGTANQQTAQTYNQLGQAVDQLAQKYNVLGQAIDQAGQKYDIFGRQMDPGAVAERPPGFARGGLLGGRGTGTSDSNLAWVSRGEHIMPARAVQQPGVLSFLEALRRSGGNLSRVLAGMGRFALGGMVPRAIPAFAAGGLAGGGNHVTIQFPGLPAISGLRASSDVVDQLHKAAALAQVRSGGRKPSRYS